MGIPKIIKADNGSRYTSRAFQQFCAQWITDHKTGIIYNLQWIGIVELSHGFLKTQLQKIKTRDYTPKSPYNALNNVLFILNFMNVDYSDQSTNDRFWHGGTRVIFAKAKWIMDYKIILALDYGKYPTLFEYEVRGMYVFFHGENEAWKISEHLVWWEQQKNASPNDPVAADAFPEELEWDHWIFLILLCHHAAVWKGKEDHGNGWWFQVYL